MPAEQSCTDKMAIAKIDEISIGINDLPTEALHLIFAFLAPGELCRTSAVCKAWRDLNKDASANRVSYIGILMPHEASQRILRFFPFQTNCYLLNSRL